MFEFIHTITATSLLLWWCTVLTRWRWSCNENIFSSIYMFLSHSRGRQPPADAVPYMAAAANTFLCSENGEFTCRNSVASGWRREASWRCWTTAWSTGWLTRRSERLLRCTVWLRWSTLSLWWSPVRGRWPPTETALLWLTLIGSAWWWRNIAWAALEIATAWKHNKRRWYVILFFKNSIV